MVNNIIEKNRLAQKHIKAFLEVHKDSSTFSKICTEVSSVATAFSFMQEDSIDKLKVVLRLQGIDARVSYIFKILDNFDISSSTKKFLVNIVKNNDIDIMLHVLKVWDRSYKEYQGISCIEVVSSIELNTKHMVDIENVLKNKIKEKFYVSYVVDKSILGGLKISIKNQVYDDTIETKLKYIKEHLKRK